MCYNKFKNDQNAMRLENDFLVEVSAQLNIAVMVFKTNCDLRPYWYGHQRLI